MPDVIIVTNHLCQTLSPKLQEHSAYFPLNGFGLKLKTDLIDCTEDLAFQQINLEF